MLPTRETRPATSSTIARRLPAGSGRHRQRRRRQMSSLTEAARQAMAARRKQLRRPLSEAASRAKSMRSKQQLQAPKQQQCQVMIVSRLSCDEILDRGRVWELQGAKCRTTGHIWLA